MNMEGDIVVLISWLCCWNIKPITQLDRSLQNTVYCIVLTDSMFFCYEFSQTRFMADLKFSWGNHSGFRTCCWTLLCGETARKSFGFASFSRDSASVTFAHLVNRGLKSSLLSSTKSLKETPKISVSGTNWPAWNFEVRKLTHISSWTSLLPYRLASRAHMAHTRWQINPI